MNKNNLKTYNSGKIDVAKEVPPTDVITPDSMAHSLKKLTRKEEWRRIHISISMNLDNRIEEAMLQEKRINGYKPTKSSLIAQAVEEYLNKLNI